MSEPEREMNDNELFALFWKLACVFACVLAVTVGSCTANRHYQVRMLVENAKINPIDAACALEADTGSTPTCVLRAKP